MGSAIDSTAPQVYDKNETQYKKGVTSESTKPGDPEKKTRNKDHS